MIPPKVKEMLQSWQPEFSPAIFKAILISLPIAAFAVPLALVAVPYLEIFNDMAVQPKGKVLGFYGWSQGKSIISYRPPVEGTIPMDYFPYALKGKDEETVKRAEAELQNPLKPTLAVLERGRKLFNTYCINCHGEEALGDGPIVGPDLFPAPPSLHTKAAREFKDGRIFHIVSRGQNIMPSYGDELDATDRWSAVHYVRVLQRALNPRPEDLEK